MIKIIIAMLMPFAFADATAQAQGNKPAAPTAPTPASRPTAALAAPAAPPAGAAQQMGVPSPEVDKLYKGFEGNWKCDTTFAVNAFGPGSPEVKTSSAVKIQKMKNLNGFWYQGQYEVKKSKTVPATFKGVFFLGYEPGTKQAMVYGIDNMGGVSWGASAPGETLAFVGEGFAMGQKVKVRETMQAKGPKEVYHKYEMDMGKGFQTFGEDVCKK